MYCSVLPSLHKLLSRKSPQIVWVLESPSEGECWPCQVSYFTGCQSLHKETCCLVLSRIFHFSFWTSWSWGQASTPQTLLLLWLGEQVWFLLSCTTEDDQAQLAYGGISNSHKWLATPVNPTVVLGHCQVGITTYLECQVNSWRRKQFIQSQQTEICL